MTQDSIYTVALKYGADNTETGITYNKLLEHLRTNNVTLDKDFQRYFHVWFYENFYVDPIYPKIKDFQWTSGDLSESVLSKYDDYRAIITGSAHQTYLEYQELKFAYKSSRGASRIAIASIIVAIIIGLIQIWIALSQTPNDIKPH